MAQTDILAAALVGAIVMVCLKIYLDSDIYNLKCIASSVDGKEYCVRENSKMDQSADLLAKITRKCKMLVYYMKEKHPNDERVKRLVEGFNPKKVMETLPTSKLTAYSENKGEKVAFCLNKRKNGSEMIDLETLTFVSIHELAHIMTKSIGHKQEFWQNFKFLLENAKDAGIHTPKDYNEQPAEYCGMTISDNPYYDL